MRLLSVREIQGLADEPTSRPAAIAWLKRLDVPYEQVGQTFYFAPSSLPPTVQLAYRLRLAEEAGLTFGPQSDAAHVELQSKPTGVQATAHERAEILAFVHRHQSAGL